jgi:hypothetical protein
MVTRRASSMMARGTQLPAKRPAATIRGSTTASQPDADGNDPARDPHGTTDLGPLERGVHERLPLGDRLLDQREDQP